MEKLPPDVVANVLSRLPIESLAQAKYVSKLWNLIIKTPSFATAHLNRHNNNKQTLILHSINPNAVSELFLLEPNAPEPHLLPLRSHLSDLRNTVAGSADGILCLDGPGDFGFPVYLCNPILNEFFTLPRSPTCPSDPEYLCVPGFACDPSTGDYKVVRLFYTLQEITSRVSDVAPVAEIFTVSINGVNAVTAGSWRLLTSPPHKLVYSTGCFLNGGLHWIANCNEDSDCIVSFDVHDEEFGVLRVPVQDSSNNLGIEVIGEQLCLFHCSFGKCLDVWMMKQYGKEESWVKEYNITQSSYSGGMDISFNHPVFLLETGKILIGCSSGFFCYDPEENVLDEYGVCGVNCDLSRKVFINNKAIHYTCSIISLKGVRARDDSFGTPGGWDTALHPWLSHERVSPPRNVFTVTPEMRMVDVKQFEDEDD